MPHVVTENCQDCRFTACVEACPVACFHGDAVRLYIDPNVCVDCGDCASRCPVHAIREDIDLAPGQEVWIEINASLAPALPIVRTRQKPLPTAADRRAALGLV